MMGCSCLYLDDLAQAFIDKGASAYLAWDATVGLDYVDETTITLMKNLCSERLTLNEAVASTMAAEGPDPKYGAVLKYYPAQTSDKALEELFSLHGAISWSPPPVIEGPEGTSISRVILSINLVLPILTARETRVGLSTTFSSSKSLASATLT